MRQCTLVFLIKPAEKKILLAMKKRGFGVGKWNGVGGKLQNDETLKEAAVRETEEEIGVKINKNDLVGVAVFDFFFETKKEFDQQVHVFFTEKWQGDSIESEEMKPKWYSYDKLPLDKMWVSDALWLPRVLSGEKIKGKFTFEDSGARVINQNIEILEQ